GDARPRRTRTGVRARTSGSPPGSLVPAVGDDVGDVVEGHAEGVGDGLGDGGGGLLEALLDVREVPGADAALDGEHAVLDASELPHHPDGGAVESSLSHA